MKKFIAALGLAAVALLVGQAYAQSPTNIAPHLTYKPLLVRSHPLTTTALVYGTESGGENNGKIYVDSIANTRKGKPAVTTMPSYADTTVPFATSNIMQPPDSVSSTLILAISAGPNHTAGKGDSVYIFPQVSVDGKWWVNVNTVSGTANTWNDSLGPKAANISAYPTLTLGASTGVVGYNPVTSCGNVYRFRALRKQSLGDNIPGNEPYIGSFWEWPLIRFVVVRNIAGSATAVYNLKYMLGYWTTHGEDSNY